MPVAYHSVPTQFSNHYANVNVIGIPGCVGVNSLFQPSGGVKTPAHCPTCGHSSPDRLSALVILVKMDMFMGMLKMILCFSLLLGGVTLRATTVELKGKAAVTGKILEVG